MHSNGKLLGLKSNDIDMCESYIFRKQRRVNFKKVGRIQKIKNWFSLDRCLGIHFISLIDGRFYFVNFIDDHFRKIWVYLMEHNSQVFDVF